MKKKEEKYENKNYLTPKKKKKEKKQNKYKRS